MRILVGNQIDPAVRDRGDLRAWTQRVLWFARNGDVVVLCAEPDQQFVDYITALIGVDRGRLQMVVAPVGHHYGRLLDPDTLDSQQCLQAVGAALDAAGTDQVSEVFALWPSPAVSRFATALGIEDRFPGAAFFAQGGGEMSNSKATFRVIAAGVGVSIPAGTVCRDVHEARKATADLLPRSQAVVVKQAHNGAGVGNELVVRDYAHVLDRVGARHLHHLASGPDGIEAYWSQRWGWASAGGRHPVVVEEFLPHAASVYSEHYAADDRALPTETGSLFYAGRRLSHQTVPLREVEAAVRVQLLDGGMRLAEAYRSMGYRGHLSADAIITPDGRVVFTEVNAQVSGSPHIYDVIARQIVDIEATPQRSVVEYHVPPTWAVPDLTTFLTAADELGCAYDAASRTGVIVSMPLIPLVPGKAQFVFCIAYASDDDRAQVWERLDTRFAAAPASTFSDSDPVGVPTRIS